MIDNVPNDDIMIHNFENNENILWQLQQKIKNLSSQHKHYMVLVQL